MKFFSRCFGKNCRQALLLLSRVEYSFLLLCSVLVIVFYKENRIELTWIVPILTAVLTNKQ